MQAWFLDIGSLFVNIIVAIGAATVLLRGSSFLFGFDLIGELQRDNRAVAYFTIGLLIMLGLVVGLFSL